MKKVLFGLFLSVVAFLSFGAVNAATVTVEVPTVVMSSTGNNSQKFWVTFESLDNAPMPTSDSKMTLGVLSGNEGKFGSVVYNKAGLYKYKIYQDKKTDSNVKYDDTIYEYSVLISVENGGVLKSSTALKKAGSEEKYTVATFSNLVKSSDDGEKKATPTPSPKPSPSNPFTGDKIIKYFIAAVIAIVIILIIIIYVKNSKEDD